MKKILALIISLNFALLPAYCTITDDFADSSLDKTLKIKITSYDCIQDDFAQNSLDQNLKIKPANYITIKDTFAESNKNKNTEIKKCGFVRENLPKITEQGKFQKKIVIFDTNAAVKIPIKICKNYSTKNKIDEVDYLDFKTTKEVLINQKAYPEGTPVKARVENVSKNLSWGVPADLVVGNFSIDNIPLAGEIEKTGANRSLWLKPCVVCFSLLFFGAGILLIPIRGGHAKIRTREIHTLYAE